MQEEFSHSCKLMGNTFEFTAVSESAAYAYECIKKAVDEIRRIEILLTTFNDNSQTNRINAAAGIEPVQVDEEVFDLVERSIRISRLTDGAFDISYGSIDKRLWNFDQGMKALPETEEARSMVKLIDYRNIILDKNEHSIFLKKKGMRIGFGGIGKGYAADRASVILQALGIHSGLVNASGDIKAWGRQADHNEWKVGIAHPDDPATAFSYLGLNNNAIATSGNYEKYAIINGRKYSHTINPKTGMPVTGIKSVTVVAPSAELADALATPVTIMGINAGIDLIEQLPGFACIMIDDYNTIYSTKNIHLQ